MKFKKNLFLSLLAFSICFISVEATYAQQRPGSEILNQDIPQSNIKTKSTTKKAMTSDNDSSKPGKSDEAKLQPTAVRQISLLENRINVVKSSLEKAEGSNAITTGQADQLREALLDRKKKLKELSDAQKRINRDLDRLKKELNADKEMLDGFKGKPERE